LQIRRVLYPTDFSPCAQQALAHATSLARRFSAELHLVHALAPPWEELYDSAGYGVPSSDASDRSRESAAARLGELADHPLTAGLRLTTGLCEGQPPGPAILDYAQRHRIDLIAMGTHGRRGPARLLLGSVAEEVARHSECPVLAVRERTGDESPATFLPRRVLVPFDFSGPARQALAAAAEIARRCDYRLLLLHVVEERGVPQEYGPLPQCAPDAVECAVGVARLRLVDLLAHLAPDVPGDVEVRSGRPATEIVSAAARPGVDMIVMSTLGLTGLRRLLFGSTAEEVLRLASVPVLLVKAPAAEPWEDETTAGTAAHAGA
jgi:nucleotide-binding universal stress UspA family protein